jgi:RNA polymerase sigma-70 factor (ECF subfamily)
MPVPKGLKVERSVLAPGRPAVPDRPVAFRFGTAPPRRRTGIGPSVPDFADWHGRCSDSPPMMSTDHPSIGGDARLLDALRRGDPAAADALVEAYGSRIYRHVNRILANRADAEEVAQDVLLTIVRRIQSFGGRSTFATWVHRVARNAALARLRRRRRDDAHTTAVSRSSDVGGNRGTGADADLARYELGEVLERAIATLPEPYRLPLILCHLEGLSTAVIAGRLGLGRAAAKSRVHRSRLLIRASLAAYVTA